MGRNHWIAILGCVLFAVVVAGVAFLRKKKVEGKNRAGDDAGEPFDRVFYQGQWFRTSRTYCDFREYKDDPDNLRADDLARATEAVRMAVVPEFLEDWDGLQQLAFSDLIFPGYGAHMFGKRALSPDSAIFFDLCSVEIPKSGDYRFFAYEGPENGPLRLMADFVAPEAVDFMKMIREEGGLAFYDHDGERRFFHSWTTESRP